MSRPNPPEDILGLINYAAEALLDGLTPEQISEAAILLALQDSTGPGDYCARLDRIGKFARSLVESRKAYSEVREAMPGFLISRAQGDES